MTRRRRAIILLLLVLVLILGALVLLLPTFIERALPSFAASAVKDRCPSCITRVGGVDLNLRELRLSLYELNIRTPQSEGISLEEGHIRLGLKHILNRRIDIREITLRALTITEFGKDSVVEQLSRSEPEPRPAQQKASAISVVLHKAELSGFSFQHSVDSRRFLGEAGALTVNGNAEEQYEINARLGSLRMLESGGKEIKLGKVQTSFRIEPTHTILEELSWLAGESRLRIEGELKDDLLSGNYKHEVSSRSPELLPELQAIITGQGKLSGSIEAPRVEGVVENKAGTVVRYSFGTQEIELSRLHSHYQVTPGENAFEVELADLVLEGPQAKAMLVEPLRISSEKLAGKLELKIESFAYEGTKVEDAVVTISLAGSLEQPDARALATIGELTYNGSRIAPIDLQASYLNDKFELTANHSSQRLGEIKLEANGDLNEEQPVEVYLETGNFNLPEFVGELKCGRLSAALDYQFLRDAPLEGSGTLSFSEAFIGCESERVDLRVANSLTIENGVLPLTGISLVMPGGMLEASGTFSNRELKAAFNGDLSLRDFSPFLPDVRDLAGTLSVALQIQGSAESPAFLGNLELSEAAANIANGKLRLSELNAGLELDNKRLVLNSLSGSVNEGDLSGEGILDLAELRHSKLVLNLNGAALDLAEPGSQLEPLILNAKAALNHGVLRAELQESNNRFSANGSYPLEGNRPAEVDLVTEKLDLAQILPGAPCTALSLSAQYQFETQQPAEGDGAIVLRNAELGCPPETVTFAAEKPLSISNGALTLDPLQLVYEQSKLSFSGTVSSDEINARLTGDARLSAFAPFVTAVDDLEGLLTVEASAEGGWDNPVFSGSLRLTDGSLAVVRAGIELEEVQATVQLAEEGFKIESFTGEFNNGELKGHGVVVLENLAASHLVLSVDDIELYPARNAFIILSAELESIGLGPDSLITGEVRIDEAEYEQNLEITQLVRNLVDSFEDRQPLLPAIEEPGEPSPSLNVKLTAPGGIFLRTNWAEAELKSSLQIKGSVSEPAFGGSLDTVQGFFGIGSRQFEIISAALLFTPGAAIPEINLRAETEILTASLERVMVFADITGPINDPRVSFSSDTGLSQQEVITLLSSGRGSSAQALVDTIAKEAGLGSFGLIGDEGLPGFLGDLTTLDRLEIVPTLNLESGAVEPRIIAERRLSSKFALSASRTFAGVDSGSTVSARYSVNRRLEATGGVTGAGGAAGSDDTRLSADLAYALIPERRGVEVNIQGEDHFDEFELFEGLSITETTRVAVEQLPALRERVLRFYNERGFFETEASVDCIRHDGQCLTLDFVIDEGPRSSIEEVVFTGDSLAGIIPAQELVFSSGKGVWATGERREEYQKRLRDALREQDYLRARIDGEYLPGSAENERILEIEITLKEPLRFRFHGNTVFSDDELLGLLEIEERPYPFGINTPYLLRDAVIQRYHARGYADVKIEPEEAEPGTYDFQITEGTQVKVRQVVLEGNEAYSSEAIKQRMSEQNREAVFSPEFLTPAYPSRAAEVITRIYVQAGYPEATVTPKVERPRPGEAIVYFYLNEGESRRAASLRVIGLPEGLTPPSKPLAPYSREVLDSYRKSLITWLENRGYRQGEVSVSFNRESKEAVFELNPGPRTTISEIRISGLRQIDEEVVRRYLKLSPGDPWDRDAIGGIRRNLRRLGLFRDVSITPADGDLDSPSEAMLVSVTERGLRHLNVGVGIDSAYGFRVFNDGADLSVFGDGKELSLNSDVYFGGDSNTDTISRALVSGRYSDPFFLGSEYRFAEDLGYQRITDTTQEFDIDRFTLSSLFSRTLDSGFSYSFGHTLLKEQLNDVEPDVILSSLDTGSVRLAFLSGNLAYDKRDDPLLPSRGYLAAADYKLSSRAVGSEADFFALGTQLAVIYPLDRIDSRFSLANSTRAAAAWTYRNTSEIPISQRYYLGGRSTVRGFRENALGPRGSLGHVIGGDRMFANSLELRYLARPRVQVHTFLDAGNVFLSGRGDYDLRWSSGIGTRYLSPVGPIGFDIAMPLDEKPGEPSIRFHFSVGAMF